MPSSDLPQQKQVPCNFVLELGSVGAMGCASGTDTPLYLPVMPLGSGSPRTLPHLRPGLLSLPIPAPEGSKAQSSHCQRLKGKKGKDLSPRHEAVPRAGSKVTCRQSLPGAHLACWAPARREGGCAHPLRPSPESRVGLGLRRTPGIGAAPPFPGTRM